MDPLRYEPHELNSDDLTSFCEDSIAVPASIIFTALTAIIGLGVYLENSCPLSELFYASKEHSNSKKIENECEGERLLGYLAITLLAFTASGAFYIICKRVSRRCSKQSPPSREMDSNV